MTLRKKILVEKAQGNSVYGNLGESARNSVYGHTDMLPSRTSISGASSLPPSGSLPYPAQCINGTSVPMSSPNAPRLSHIGAIAYQNAVQNIENTVQGTAVAQNMAAILFNNAGSKSTSCSGAIAGGPQGGEIVNNYAGVPPNSNHPVGSPSDEREDLSVDEVGQMKFYINMVRGLFPRIEAKCAEASSRRSELLSCQEENRMLREKVARLEEQVSRMRAGHQQELKEIEKMYAGLLDEHERTVHKLEQTSSNVIASMMSPEKTLLENQAEAQLNESERVQEKLKKAEWAQPRSQPPTVSEKLQEQEDPEAEAEPGGVAAEAEDHATEVEATTDTTTSAEEVSAP